jgi:hypothetical protein
MKGWIQMIFRSYTNVLSQASRSLAAGILTVGLLLMGFGVVIAAFPEVFAFLAAAIFFMAGASCAVIAAKILWAQWRLNHSSQDPAEPYRYNVRIHTHEYHDV